MTAPHPRRARHIHVQSWQDLSPNLRRIVFHSPELADYPYRCNGAHIKLLFPRDGQTAPQLPEYSETRGIIWHDKTAKPLARAYTLRHFDRERLTLTVDFVLHGDNGPASAFAEAPAVGRTVGLSVPGGPVPMLKPAARYLFAGDLTALPAIHAMLEEADPQAEGDLLLWLPEPADLPGLPLPAAMRLHTFYAPLGRPDTAAEMAEQFARCRPAQNDVYIWIAGEADLTARLRRTARQDWQIPLKNCYAIPYWRIGENEDDYHDKRHDFLDSDATGSLN
ncbi:siderophore-interacting protein [Neisseria leonii]|uniref:Siderophore-interacting protein n=1 Tax=Neisseria leonii TaxID=2995413 RepID=A0A9X4E3B3_9NEIS|nr:siderophore-interacting protein [Neisseria sp. 51.81]MDD9327181.1 siderophore-interacting protein [Neisseria sp. 51.81]